MSEEIKEELRDEKKCNCDKKELNRFLLTILGSFLGCLVALCLYGATVKPQPPQPAPMPCALNKMHNPGIVEHNGPHHDFHRKDFRRDFKGPQKFDRNNVIPPVKPETK